MAESVTFRTRARTIDHLGRGQIADMPTAITELWKNAYDAYAKNVSLHIFEGDSDKQEIHAAAIFDDGYGMSRDDFEQRWLVIGTESKIAAPMEDEEQRFGLPERPRQGEKGIGRLSAAFIAPVAFVVSKKIGGNYVAAAIDWRLFENPFLAMDDIRLPIREFAQPEELEELIPGMYEVLLSNVQDEEDEERNTYLQGAWDRFSKYERAKGSAETTAEVILARREYSDIVLRCLGEWETFNNLCDHGTALVMLGIQPALGVWVEPSLNVDYAEEIRNRLRETLVEFTDSLTENRLKFDYEVLIHRKTGLKREISTQHVFGLDDFLELEHSIRGGFDEKGVFKGRVTAFGKDLGIKEFVPRISVQFKARDHVGPFSFCIGTFELDVMNSTLSPERVSWLKDQLQTFMGIKVYRDGLRVQPYGRHDSDFFEIEERRSQHAGRHFWSHRRSFGSLSFSSASNPNLKDKAGREGLVDNQAKRELRHLVIGVLEEFAKRYFGSASPIRAEMIEENRRRNARDKSAAESARKRRRKSLRVFIKEQTPVLSATHETIACTEQRIVKATDSNALALTEQAIKELDGARTSLRPPSAPSKAGDLEDSYRVYRDSYQEFTAGLEHLKKKQSEQESVLGKADPEQVLRKHFSSNQSVLSAKVDVYLKEIDGLFSTLLRKWRTQGEKDRSIYYKQCSSLLEEDIEHSGLVTLLNLLDLRYQELDETFTYQYEGLINAIGQLEEGIDLDGALIAADDERAQLEDQVRQLNAVAQLGISVEIIGHELESLDESVRRNLQKLPADCRKTHAFKLASEEHAAMTDRLRFLSPMKVAGYRSRELIKGDEIAEYVMDFFSRHFEEERINFTATKAFRGIKIRDLRSRIYPSFINLVNNAVYWSMQSVEREIIIDFVDGKVIVADSGPGVDSDDVERLFTLFFTRRRAGRGVGLYLTKANLAVANHRIRYAVEEDPKILSGANFIIEFSGMIEEK